MASERSKRAYDLRMQGKTLREIGDALGGVSVERARQMVKQWERRSAEPVGLWSEAERAGVKTRTINALKRAKFTSKRDIAATIKAGATIDEIGGSGLADIRTWLKIKEPAPSPPSAASIQAAVSILTRAGYKIPEN